MRSLSRDYSTKLLHIRKAENLTQKEFSRITGIPLSTIQKYERGHQNAKAEIMERVLQVDKFEKYTLWLIRDKTIPNAGQISPLLSPGGSTQSADAQASTEHAEKSPLSDQKIG